MICHAAATAATADWVAICKDKQLGQATRCNVTAILLTGICDLLPDTFLSHIFPFFPVYRCVFLLLGFLNSLFLSFLPFNVITSELFLSLTVCVFLNNAFFLAVGGVLATDEYTIHASSVFFPPYLLKYRDLFLIICSD